MPKTATHRRLRTFECIGARGIKLLYQAISVRRSETTCAECSRCRGAPTSAPRRTCVHALNRDVWLRAVTAAVLLLLLPLFIIILRLFFDFSCLSGFLSTFNLFFVHYYYNNRSKRSLLTTPVSFFSAGVINIGSYFTVR